MKLIAACIVSFLITLVTGRFLLPELHRLKAGQSIREDGPTWHAGKSGTPTMGGLMFIFGILVTILVFGWDAMRAGSFAHLYVFAFAAVFGLIGFLDDFQKVKMHRNLGLTAIQKFALQLAAAVVFLCLMRYEGMLTPNLYIPFVNTYIILNWVVYMIFAAFVIVGTVNAVNITDGIDGLAGSVTVPVALFFAVVGSWWGYENDLGVFAAAMVGGLIGFLVYNFHPAKVFMGDTGSLFLGGAVAGLAFAYDMPLVLLLVGIEEADTQEDIDYLAGKASRLRVFDDEAGVMNLDVRQTAGELLVVSQFTLHASTRKGNRPSYFRAAGEAFARPMYERFVAALAAASGRPVRTGEFGADMAVELVNDGPVTIWIDSKNKE